MDIKRIIGAIKNERVKVTRHAHKEAEDDWLSYDEILLSVVRGEVIEDYPNDRPYPSCLILGSNLRGMPIHSVWAYNSEDAVAILVTVYKPDPALWINWRERVGE